MKKYQHPAIELENLNSEIIMYSFDVASLFNGNGEGNDTDVDSFSFGNWKPKQ